MQVELVGGLRPNARLRRGQAFLYDAYGVEATAYGLRGARPVEDPIQQSLDWPFPHLIRGEASTFLLGRNVVSTINETTWLPTTQATVSSGGRWQLADAGDAWYLFNGSCVVYRIGGVVRTETERVPNAGIVHRGRVVCGGFDADMLPPQWIVDALFENELVVEDFLRPNFVLWSSIGGGDFPLWLFGSYEDADFAHEDLIRKVKENTLGWTPMHSPGQVQGFHPLGPELVVFGSDGIGSLFLASGTYGRRQVSYVGVPNRSAFAGSTRVAFWVDQRGRLRMWSGGENPPVTLGFEEYIQPLLGMDLVLSYDELFQRLFISDGTQCFVLNTENRESPALTEFPQFVTSVATVDGETVGVVEDIESEEGLVVLPEFDGGLRSIKTLTGVGINAQTSGKVWAAVDYRYNDTDVWRTSPWVLLNPEGNAVLRVSGVDFRARIRFEQWTDLHLDYVDLRWQAFDHRFTRGPYVGQNSPE